VRRKESSMADDAHAAVAAADNTEVKMQLQLSPSLVDWGISPPNLFYKISSVLTEL